MKKLWKISLVWKMTLITTLLLLIPVGALCISYIQTFRLSVSTEAKDKMNTSLNHMQNNIDGALSDVKAIYNEMFYRQELSYFMNKDNVLSEKEIRFYVSSLQKELNNTRYLYAGKYSDIGFYASNTQIETEPYPWMFYLEDLKEKKYYAEVEHAKTELSYGAVRSGYRISANFDTSQLNMGKSGKIILPVYRKVLDLNTGELVGVVEIDIDVTKLAGKDMLESENEEIGNLLLDEHKKVLFDTKRFSSGLEEKITNAITKDKGTIEVGYENKRYMGVYERCGRTGFMKVAILSKEGIMQYVISRSVKIVMITIVCLLLLFLITYYLMNNALKRLVVLDHMMGKVGKGDFSVKIPDDPKTDDEITRITGTFNKMASRLDQVMEERVQDEKTKKDAEVRALQAQINPHFLYNTLENMRMQCEIGEAGTLGDSISALGELFRYSISWGSNEAPFANEWENLKNYLYIMEMRFGEDITCELECEDGLEAIPVPKLILQPLVENSFNHGFKDKLPCWKLSVSAKRAGESLQIVITDNGKGIDVQAMQRIQNSLKNNQVIHSKEKQRNSIGITNVKQRIDMLCKAGSSFHIENAKEGGVRIEIRIVL